jgi:hypothetical protein
MTATKEMRDVPAASTIGLPDEGEGLLARTSPEGGSFVDLLVPYLGQKDKFYQNYTDARASLPPPLMREGEKVQPSWLFQFLRDPQPIRPAANKILRMPKFNMSDDEAMALVNYFAAVDKLENPGGGLNYPYLAVPQRSDEFWHDKTRQYVAKLKQDDKKYQERLKGLEPIGEWLRKERLNDVEKRIPEEKAAVAAAKDAEAKETDPAKKKEKEDARKKAEQALETLEKEAKDLKDEAKAKELQMALLQKQKTEWETEEAYASDAFRFLTNYNNPCMTCHRVGNLKAGKTREEEQGPPLDLAWQRLRPEWTERWLANPDRMLSYKTPMPANFGRSDKPYAEIDGSMQEQLRAVRDILLNYPKIADMPANRFYTPVTPGGGK